MPSSLSFISSALQQENVPRWRGALLPLALLGALALFPLVASALGLDFYIGFVRRVLVVALAAASLNFIMGFGGMVAWWPWVMPGSWAWGPMRWSCSRMRA